MKYHYTTQEQVRAAFWAGTSEFKRIPGQSQNDYPAIIHTAFCSFVDAIERWKDISPAFARRITL